MDLCKASAKAIAAAVAKGEVSAREVTAAHLSRIHALDGKIHAFTDVTAERALREADAIDAQRGKGIALPPLAGVPYAVKNLFDVKGLPTRAGSKINRERKPATDDATAITRLARAGGVLLGALNMGEYAYDFTGRNAHDGHVANPRDLRRLSGGSSSGSAAAVAAGFCPISLGSDTNGSVRVPSSLCGTFGLKPTYGRISRAGSFPFVSSLDHVGVFARSVDDLALAYEASAGPDSHDPVAAQKSVDHVAALLCKGAAGLRIAVAGGYFKAKRGKEASAAVSTIAKALKVTQEVTILEAHRARAAAYVITSAEGGALHIDRLRSRAQDFDPETRDRLIAGAMVPAAWVIAAQRFRRWYHAEVVKLFDKLDIIIAPATPVPAPLIDQTAFEVDGEQLWVRGMLGLFTQPISFIGLPVVAAPIVAPGELPIAVQLIAAPWREDLALRVAAALEEAGICQAPVADL